MNYIAMQLLEAGAKRVFGLACEKTCSVMMIISLASEIA
jgi:hypothetical protein